MDFSYQDFPDSEPEPVLQATYDDRTGMRCFVSATAQTVSIGACIYGEYVELDAPRVDALIALLQRWRATGQLRPEGEGAASDAEG